MQSKIRLPRLDNIVWLEQLAQPFPVSAAKIKEIALDWEFGKVTLEFLDQFEDNEIFESGEDFFNRCSEMELLIKEESKMPAEKLRNPLD